MKRLFFVSAVALTINILADSAPLPVQNPFEMPAPKNNDQEVPANSPGTGTAPNTPVNPDMPEGLGATPEGLNGQLLTIWKQNYLTGDWGGFRDTMLNSGIAISPTYLGETMGNVSGGALGRRGVIYDGILNTALDLNMDRLTNGAVDDMLIHANAIYIHGPSLSSQFVGDFSNTSNLSGYNTLRLQELWLQKGFWEKRISVRAGNMAVDSEFFASQSASLFLNGTFGAFTLIGSNVPNAPIYPVASPGVRIAFYPTSKFYVMSGVYGMDRSSTPALNNQNGTRFALDGGSGMLVMSEGGYLLNQSPNDRGLQGTYRLGSFIHTANYTTWDSQAQAALGTGSLQSAGTNYGLYGVMDQQIYLHGEEAISMFIRTGYAPSSVNFVDYYSEGGFNFTGFIPGRYYDVGGIALARSHVSNNFSNDQVLQGGTPSTAETVIEASYKVQIAPWWSIQPDVQYIITPSGVAGSPNAVVLGVRTSVAF